MVQAFSILSSLSTPGDRTWINQSLHDDHADHNIIKRHRLDWLMTTSLDKFSIKLESKFLWEDFTQRPFHLVFPSSIMCL